MKNFLFNLSLVVVMLIVPSFSFAQSGLVPCGVESYGEDEIVNGEDVSYQHK
mgnify:FL=1